jgi:hypothetical protein
MFWIDVVSRVVHVSTAIVLIGGSAFTLLVLMPAAKKLGEEAHDSLRAAVNGRWKRFIHIGILLFLVSGFYNYFQAIGKHQGDGLYHGLLGIKMLLAFAIFFVASALVGKSPKFKSMRQSRAKWLTFIVAAAAVIVCISGYVKIRGVPAEAESVAQVEPQ